MSSTTKWFALSLAKALHRVTSEERGIATAVSTLGPLIASLTLATAITATQDDSLSKVQSTVDGSIDRLSTAIHLPSPVLAQPDASGAHLGRIMIPVTLLVESTGLPLSEHDGPVVMYRDSDEEVLQVPYEIEWIDSDDDALLEYGELARLNALVGGSVLTGAGEPWTLEVIHNGDVLLSVTRRLPPILQPLMALP